MSIHFKNYYKKKPLMLCTSLLLFGATDARDANHPPISIVTTAEEATRAEPGSQGFLQKALQRETEIKIKNHRGRRHPISHDDEVGYARDQSGFLKIAQGKKAVAGKETAKQPGDRQSQIDGLRRRKKNIRREIDKGRQEVEAFTQRESDIIKRLNRIERALDTARKRAAEKKREIEKLDHMIEEASTASQELRKRIHANEKKVSRRLVALYKMSRLGKFHLLASAKSMNEFIQRKAAFKRILAYDEKIRKNLIDNQTELKKMLTSLNRHKALKSVHAAEYRNQTRLMSLERSRRTKLLADIRKQKALELAAIDALTRAANDLEHKLKLLNTKKIEAASDKNIPQLSFDAHKGLLIMPVNGKITNLFGRYKNAKYNITNFRSGIDIQADLGEPVRAVFNGKVIYSDWFKGYGNMIIIDHGSNYYTVYAHMQETFKSKGDEVDTGEVIAAVGDTGSMTGAKLYFEVRHHGKPMNPLKWLKKG